MTLALAISLATLSVVGAAPSSAASTKDRLALGDSVMLGAKGNLKALGFGVVDATESRQAYDGPRLLRTRGSSLPENVIVHLGTNGTFPLDVCRKIVKAAGPERRVFFVTIHVPRSWEKGNNAVIRDCDAVFAADRVHVIDWDWAASRHPGWLYSDGTHLRPDGAAAFARIVNREVDEAIEQARIDALGDASGSVTVGAG